MSFTGACGKDVDGRHTAGHDGKSVALSSPFPVTMKVL